MIIYCALLFVALCANAVPSISDSHADGLNSDAKVSASIDWDAAQTTTTQRKRDNSERYRLRKYALGLPTTARLPQELKLLTKPNEWVGPSKAERNTRRRRILDIKRKVHVPQDWKKLSYRELSHVEKLRASKPDITVAEAVEQARAFHSHSLRVALPGSTEPDTALRESFRLKELVHLAVPRSIEAKYKEEIRKMNVAQTNARLSQDFSYPSWYHEASSSSTSPSLRSREGLKVPLLGRGIDIDLNKSPVREDDI